jgi:hypothetical protein
MPLRQPIERSLYWMLGRAMVTPLFSARPAVHGDNDFRHMLD